MTWVDQSSLFGFGAVLTSTQIQNMRDNLTSVANGDISAPSVWGASRKFLHEVLITSSTSVVEFPGYFNSSFDIYQLEFNNLRSADYTPGVSSYSSLTTVMQVSNDVGSNYYVSSANYSYKVDDEGGAVANFPGMIMSAIHQGDFASVQGCMTLYKPTSSTIFKLAVSDGFRVYETNATTLAAVKQAFINVSCVQEYNSMRLLNYGGTVNITDSQYNFVAGKFTLFGIDTSSYLRR